MIDNISLIAQNAIRIMNKEGKVIYFDPFKINGKFKNDADVIFITHSHFDHFSPEDIMQIKKDSTVVVAPKDLQNDIERLEIEHYLIVSPNEINELNGMSFSTIPAYNTNKNFHKKEYDWVGYIVDIDGKKVYVAGDTDDTPEARSVKCDVALVPIGGTYTMNAEEAVELIKNMKPSEMAIPTHYQTIVGSKKDALKFKELLKDVVNVEILM